MVIAEKKKQDITVLTIGGIGFCGFGALAIAYAVQGNTASAIVMGGIAGAVGAQVLQKVVGDVTDAITSLKRG